MKTPEDEVVRGDPSVTPEAESPRRRGAELDQEKDWQRPMDDKKSSALAGVIPLPPGPPRIELRQITKRFGPLTVLDNVSMVVPPGSFHALLGGNGAGKSTLVKCLMGYYLADSGDFIVHESQELIRSTREARRLGIGMVYQHFTLVPNMTVAENLVLSRDDVPMLIHWKKEIEQLEEFMAGMPFKVPLNVPVRTLAAGEKQKLEILKQLYLKTRILILDEPTSVLTPQEADDVLGMVHQMTREKKISVILITHKFQQVMQFADECTILRLGKRVGGGSIRDMTPAQMAELMVGSEPTAKLAARTNGHPHKALLTIEEICAEDETGLPAIMDITLQVNAGEIVAITGVSGNGQSELVEVLAGQRTPTAGKMTVNGKPYSARRTEMRAHRVFCLPEEPLKNACVPDMGVGHNMALRNYDVSPFALGGFWLRHKNIRKAAWDLIKRYKVKTPSPETQIRDLSGGNVQRAVLARELSGEVNVLVAANPCFGLDFAAVADIRAQIMAARNRGAAVLLVSEDLDEVFELADRILVMFDGQIVYETASDAADLKTIGRYMAGHTHEEAAA